MTETNTNKMSMTELVSTYNGLVKTHKIEGFNAIKKFSTKKLGIERIEKIKNKIPKSINKVPENSPFKKVITEKMLTPVRMRKGATVQSVDELVTRAEAIERKIQLYWNGTPCERDHVSPRYTVSGECKKCYQMFRAEEISQSEISKDPLAKRKEI